MPLRDDRRGRRATIGSGKAPLRPDFSSATTATTSKPDTIANDSPTPDLVADDVCNRDLISGGPPLERARHNSSGTTEASSDAREAERNGSSRISASVEAQTDAPSIEAYADAPLVEAHANAPFAKAHADAFSTKAHADTPSVKAHADAPMVNARADAPSAKARAEAPSAEARADAATAEAHNNAPSLEALVNAPLVEANTVAPWVAAHVDSPSSTARADSSSIAAYADASSVAAHPDTPSVAAHADAPSVMVQPRSLLEPADVLMAMVRPFTRLRSALIGFANLPIIGSSNVSPHVPADEETRPAVIVERSFANEVASLLQAPMEVVPPPQYARDTSSSFAPAPATPTPFAPVAATPAPSATPDRSRPAIANYFVGVATTSAEPPVERPALDRATAGSSNDTARIDAPAMADALPRDGFERDEPAEGPTYRNSVLETRIGVAGDSKLALDAWKSGPPEKREGVVAGETPEHTIVVTRVPSRQERAVPITRLPLRPQGLDITWTADVPEFERAGPFSRTARHAWLERLVRNPGGVSSDAIVRAYRQEEGEGRAIALRVLLRNFPQAGRSAFVEALRVGSDEERALAIDGLTAIGAREELAPALCDRVDAIAAKAALSYVGTLERADYRTELSPFVDEARIEAILNLLAGIVE